MIVRPKAVNILVAVFGQFPANRFEILVKRLLERFWCLFRTDHKHSILQIVGNSFVKAITLIQVIVVEIDQQYDIALRIAVEIVDILSLKFIENSWPPIRVRHDLNLF